MAKLYIVSTPIGNLGDITYRAVETLRSVDFVASEDTRVTLKLLNHFGIQKPMVSYYEHNKAQRGDVIVKRILSGESCALTTDAGTPAISDPGSMLVRQCREAGIEVVSVPGACAAVAAFSMAGLDSGRFTFEGFLAMNRRGRKEHLESLRTERRPMIFYEAPHKLLSTLEDMSGVFGEDRRLFIAREITKMHEQCISLTFREAIEMYKENPPRGEFVLIIEGRGEAEAEYTLQDAIDLAKELIDSGMSSRDAAREASAKTGVPKNNIYSGII
ncbi:MAG: 16S rRNA (cytidine(1402)-2'-O)-methyltransferase [Clostridiales bacterium]|jgi:16S rRNA (cytidine1402-2'-O)-methyltransferase|nr:16S rRNA (cytidine(1402)-2'-O)-methyltransferase [Clostridiales bacterium]